MAFEAERANVVEIALATAFHHRNDMVGIPEAFSRTGPQAPFERSFQARRTPQAFKLQCCTQTIYGADGAHATIPFENLFAEVAWIGTETPLLHAPSRAKRDPSFGNFQTAPAAKMAAVGALGKAFADRPATGHSTLCTQELNLFIPTIHREARIQGNNPGLGGIYSVEDSYGMVR